MPILNWEIVMPNDNASHLDDEEIESYSGGKATKAQEEAWEEHLLLCETCRDRLEFSETFANAMEAAAALQVRDPRGIREPGWNLNRLFPAFPVFAALAAAALIVAAWFGLGKFRPGAFPGNSTPAVVTLYSVRGSEVVSAPAGRPITLHLDLTALPQTPKYRLEVVDAAGNSAWEEEVKVSSQFATASVPAQKPGSYFVRLYSPAGELLREYALAIANRD